MQNKSEFRRMYQCLPGLFIVALAASCSSSSSNNIIDDGANPAQSIPAIGFRLEQIDVDEGADQVVDQLFKLTYNEAGLAVGERIDDNADGVDDHSFTYDYADGRLIGSSYDQLMDDVIDKTRVFTYDADGFLLSVVADDGSVQERTDYILSDSGTLSGAQLDRDNDSVVDEVANYLYNSNGKISTIDFDNDGDSVSDVRVSFVYDDAGRVVRRERDVGVDNVLEDVWIYNYVQALCDPASNHQPLNHSCIF